MNTQTIQTALSNYRRFRTISFQSNNSNTIHILLPVTRPYPKFTTTHEYNYDLIKFVYGSVLFSLTLILCFVGMIFLIKYCLKKK